MDTLTRPVVGQTWKSKAYTFRNVVVAIVDDSTAEGGCWVLHRYPSSDMRPSLQSLTVFLDEYEDPQIAPPQDADRVWFDIGHARDGKVYAEHSEHSTAEAAARHMEGAPFAVGVLRVTQSLSYEWVQPVVAP